jgi:5'-3' exonuclease
MDVYLVDGTYELFRHFFGVPSHVNAEGQEVAAARGVVGSMLGLLEGGATHLGVATDHVIESFRNAMWATYKSSAGVDPRILSQFQLLEDGLEALGVTLWPMVEWEADDALASAAAVADASASVDRVYICTPDKDLGQCVRGDRVVQLDRRARKVSNEDGIIEKFGVRPESIPDFLGLVGDSADGFPGLPGWGARSTATVLWRYPHLEAIPLDSASWDLSLRGADRLTQTLSQRFDDALLFRDLATLRTQPPVLDDVDSLRWQGPTPAFEAFCARVEQPDLLQRAQAQAARRSVV